MEYTELVYPMVAMVDIPVVDLRRDILDADFHLCRMLEEDLRHQVEWQELALLLGLLVRLVLAEQETSLSLVVEAVVTMEVVAVAKDPQGVGDQVTVTELRA